MSMEISFRLNGEKRTLVVEPNEILLHVLRERLGIKSPKSGCERGECGTCTVFIDKKTVKSCLVLAVEVNGREVTTLEGLMKNGQMTSLQKTFLDHNSFQCGFCAPGVVLSATELLKKKKHPTREEIQEGLGGNLCRCTGYSPIIEAIEIVADKGKES